MGTGSAAELRERREFQRGERRCLSLFSAGQGAMVRQERRVRIDRRITPGFRESIRDSATDETGSYSSADTNGRLKSQERRLMMDVIFVLALIGFFALSVAYTYAFDRI
jgi:hypothetical protein